MKEQNHQLLILQHSVFQVNPKCPFLTSAFYTMQICFSYVLFHTVSPINGTSFPGIYKKLFSGTDTAISMLNASVFYSIRLNPVTFSFSKHTPNRTNSAIHDFYKLFFTYNHDNNFIKQGIFSNAFNSLSDSRKCSQRSVY